MKIGFTAGAWDLFHPGHLLFLGKCKEHCDTLIVGLHTNPTYDRPNKNVPTQTTWERWVQLKACSHVDRIIPYDTEEDLNNMLSVLDINTYFIGSDHKNHIITGREVCLKRSIGICFVDRLHNYSSSALRQRIKYM